MLLTFAELIAKGYIVQEGEESTLESEGYESYCIADSHVLLIRSQYDGVTFDRITYVQFIAADKDGPECVVYHTDVREDPYNYVPSEKIDCKIFSEIC